MPPFVSTWALVAVSIFTVCLLGIMTRPAGSLAMVWPANALTLGLLLRTPPGRRLAIWLAAPVAFVAADMATGTSLTRALLLNAANLYGVAAAYAVTRFIPESALKLRDPQSVLWYILVAVVGAAAAGFFAALSDPFPLGYGKFGDGGYWFASELVNYVALLPLISSMPPIRSLHPHRPSLAFLSQWRRALPVTALVAACALAMFTGGPGAVAFAVPALIWCGLAYSVFTVSLLAFAFAVWSLTVISAGYLHHLPGTLDGSAVVSLRLAAFMIALAPVTLSIVMRNRDELIHKLSVARQRTDAAMEAGGVGGTWEFDVATGRMTVETNDSFPDAALYRSGQPVGDVLANLIHPDDRKYIHDAIHLSIATGADCRCTYRTTAYDGDVRWLTAFGKPIFDQHNLVSRLIGVCVNITERQKVAEALELSDKRFNIVAESIPDIVWSTDGNGRHDYFNRRWHEFTGIEPDDINPETWTGLVHPDDEQRVMETWTACLKTGKPYSIDYRFRHRDGRYRWLRVQAKPLRDAQDVIVRWYGTSTDIDDAKRIEAEREAVARELDHRIGNLFALVNGLVNVSVRDADTVQGVVGAIRGRLRALHDAHSLVRRGDTRGATSMVVLLQTLLRPYDDGSGRISISGDDLQIAASAVTPLSLVFHELATNAMKYGALHADKGLLRIRLSLRGDRLAIDWREESPSLPPTGKGTGFGSKLFKLIVEGQLHGTAAARSEPEGFAMDMRLPLSSLSGTGASGTG